MHPQLPRARSAERAGIPYPKLLQLIVRAALEPAPYDQDVPMLPAINRPPVEAKTNGTGG